MTQRVVVPRADRESSSYLDEPGPWWERWPQDPVPAGWTVPYSVMICCPNGHKAFYGFGPKGHTVSPTGEVNPSTVCPDYCGWHVWVTLGGWEEKDNG